MNTILRPFVLLLTICFLSSRLSAQDDADVDKLMKQAAEMQKQAEESSKTSPASKMDMKKKLAEMEKQAKEEEARQEQEEKLEKQKLQAALKKQLDEPGALALPDWTPATPQFAPKGSLAKKIVEDEVRIIQSGTSTLAPRELLEAWKTAVADKALNNFSNDISSNGSVTTRLVVSTRTGSEEKVTLEARREADGKITQVEIYQTLPKPNLESE